MDDRRRCSDDLRHVVELMTPSGRARSELGCRRHAASNPAGDAVCCPLAITLGARRPAGSLVCDTASYVTGDNVGSLRLEAEACGAVVSHLSRGAALRVDASRRSSPRPIADAARGRLAGGGRATRATGDDHFVQIPGGDRETLAPRPLVAIRTLPTTRRRPERRRLGTSVGRADLARQLSRGEPRLRSRSGSCARRSASPESGTTVLPAPFERLRRARSPTRRRAGACGLHALDAVRSA